MSDLQHKFKRFTRCPDCEHENYLFDCPCENEGCICYKKRNNDWNGKDPVNGSALWEPYRRSASL